MKLHEAIAYAIDKEGTEIVGRSLLVNYLADLQAYDTPAVKRIVETIVDEGYGERLLGSIQAADYDLQVADTVSRMVKYEGYQQDIVEYVLNCISYALGKNVEQPVSPITEEQGTSQLNKHRTVNTEKQNLSFIQTSNGYQTELDGETYTIGEREYKAIMLMKDMPIERLKIWVKAYSEREEYMQYIEIKDHSVWNNKYYGALFKEAGAVSTTPKKHKYSDEQFSSLWTNLYRFCQGVISYNDLVKMKSAYEREWEIKTPSKGIFYTEMPPKEDAIRKEVSITVGKEYDTTTLLKSLHDEQAVLNSMSFTEEKPSEEDVRAILTFEAKQQVKSFMLWKLAEMRNEYVEMHLENALQEAQAAWQHRKEDYDRKREAQQKVVDKKRQEIENICQERDKRVQEKVNKIYKDKLDEWNKKRDQFFEMSLRRIQNGIDGGRFCVEGAIGTAFDLFWYIDLDLDINMKFFVDFVYEEENGIVLVDLNLPKIEDTPTKQRKDYANCVFGLSMYVANTIFNQSVKIKEVEIAGHTQRVANNSALVTDQYLFVVRYERELFDRISVSSYTPVQMVEFFPHCKSMTETYLLREINLATAYNRMDASAPVDFDEYVALHPMPEETSDFDMQDNIATDNNDAPYIDMHHLDPLLEQAAYAIIDAGMGSTSVIQRKLEIGYNRAGRIMDQLEKMGIIGSAKGSKPREILVTDRQVVHILTKD